MIGGENGIDVESARRVEDRRRPRRSARSWTASTSASAQVMIHDCAVVVAGPFAQGIDISYSMYARA